MFKLMKLIETINPSADSSNNTGENESLLSNQEKALITEQVDIEQLENKRNIKDDENNTVDKNNFTTETPKFLLSESNNNILATQRSSGQMLLENNIENNIENNQYNIFYNNNINNNDQTILSQNFNFRKHNNRGESKSDEVQVSKLSGSDGGAIGGNSPIKFNSAVVFPVEMTLERAQSIIMLDSNSTEDSVVEVNAELVSALKYLKYNSHFITANEYRWSERLNRQKNNITFSSLSIDPKPFKQNISDFYLEVKIQKAFYNAENSTLMGVENAVDHSVVETEAKIRAKSILDQYVTLLTDVLNAALPEALNNTPCTYHDSQKRDKKYDRNPVLLSHNHLLSVFWQHILCVKEEYAKPTIDSVVLETVINDLRGNLRKKIGHPSKELQQSKVYVFQTNFMGTASKITLPLISAADILLPSDKRNLTHIARELQALDRQSGEALSNFSLNDWLTFTQSSNEKTELDILAGYTTIAVPYIKKKIIESAVTKTAQLLKSEGTTLDSFKNNSDLGVVYNLLNETGTETETNISEYKKKVSEVIKQHDPFHYRIKLIIDGKYADCMNHIITPEHGFVSGTAENELNVFIDQCRERIDSDWPQASLYQQYLDQFILETELVDVMSKLKEKYQQVLEKHWDVMIPLWMQQCAVKKYNKEKIVEKLSYLSSPLQRLFDLPMERLPAIASITKKLKDSMKFDSNSTKICSRPQACLDIVVLAQLFYAHYSTIAQHSPSSSYPGESQDNVLSTNLVASADNGEALSLISKKARQFLENIQRRLSSNKDFLNWYPVTLGIKDKGHSFMSPIVYREKPQTCYPMAQLCQEKATKESFVLQDEMNRQVYFWQKAYNIQQPNYFNQYLYERYVAYILERILCTGSIKQDAILSPSVNTEQPMAMVDQQKIIFLAAEYFYKKEQNNPFYAALRLVATGRKIDDEQNMQNLLDIAFHNFNSMQKNEAQFTLSNVRLNLHHQNNIESLSKNATIVEKYLDYLCRNSEESLAPCLKDSRYATSYAFTLIQVLINQHDNLDKNYQPLKKSCEDCITDIFQKNKKFIKSCDNALPVQYLAKDADVIFKSSENLLAQSYNNYEETEFKQKLLLQHYGNEHVACQRKIKQYNVWCISTVKSRRESALNYLINKTLPKIDSGSSQVNVNRENIGDINGVNPKNLEDVLKDLCIAMHNDLKTLSSYSFFSTVEEDLQILNTIDQKIIEVKQQFGENSLAEITPEEALLTQLRACYEKQYPKIDSRLFGLRQP